jgi:PhnB protein
MKEIVTYLKFDGNCREVMEFYAKCLEAELQLTPYSQMPGELPKPLSEAKERIMHARLTKRFILLMASDIMPGMPLQQGNNFSVSITCESLEEIKKLFTALSENGTVTMPLQDMFWGAHFGMLKDRFGINWMLNFEYSK